VVASPLLRAAETATIIAEGLGIGPVLTDPDLVERDAGEWQGLTRTQIEEGWPGFLDEGRRPPGYEPGDAMLARVRSVLEHISERMGDGEVLVVSHGGVVYALEEACGEPWVRLPNLGARWFEVSGDDLSAGPRVDLVPDGTVPNLL
jgi:probable phosphoglycerate mutase